MIFLAVGTQKFQMNRILKKMDELIMTKEIIEPVFAQTGNSDYLPQNFEHYSFLTKQEFEQKVNECDILVTHGGVSTIMTGINYNKRIVVVPRLAKFGEHVDNHQLEIAQSFLENNFVLVCGEEDDLGKIIRESRLHAFASYTSQRMQMIETIREFLGNI